MKPIKRRYWLAPLLLAAVWFAYTEFGGWLYSVQCIREYPFLLNRTTLRGGKTDNLTIKNVVLRGTQFKDINLDDITFENVTFVGAVFDRISVRSGNIKNVTFKDCKFVTTRFTFINFENVIFCQSSFSYSEDSSVTYMLNRIEYSDLNNVFFDTVSFENHIIKDVSGVVIFKNIKNININKNINEFIGANKLLVKIENCHINGAKLATAWENSILYATNSTFTRSELTGDKSKLMYIEKCRFQPGILGNPELLILKDSIFSGSVKGTGRLYLINNEYPLPPQTDPSDGCSLLLGGSDDSHAYIFGNDKQASLDIRGDASIYDMDILKLSQRSHTMKPLITLNLKNVAIHGGEWQNLKLDGGKWENVAIYPSAIIRGAVIKRREAVIKNVEGYNVTFPGGTPWKGESKEGPAITMRDQPFDWPEVHVPTPEELGLTTMWPEVTGGPKPD